MTHTVYSNGTVVQPGWLNDVDNRVYVESHSVVTYGALPTNIDSVNKTALQAAIADCSSLGGGTVVVPPSISYGFKVADSTTWPDFSAATAPILVEDYGVGKSYSGFPTAYDGKQVRRFFFTPQTTKSISFTVPLLSGATSGTLSSAWTDISGVWIITFSNGDKKYVTLANGLTTATWTGGLTSNVTSTGTLLNPGNHDGNTAWHRASWAPAILISNDAKLAAASDPTRTAVDNRRANLYFGSDGIINWKVGQGQLAGAQYTDEELTNLGITLYGSSVIGDFNWLTVERKTGNASFGGQLNTPPASFHFKSPSTGVVQMMVEGLSTKSEIYMRNSSGVAQDVVIRNNAGDLTLKIDALGDAFTVRGSNRRCVVGLSLVQQVFAVTYSTSMTIDTTKGNIASITATNNTAFTINAPTNPSGVSGETQKLTITIRNTSGGALGAATWNALFKMSTWTQPANGFSRSITFYFDGANWIEMNRTTADIPN